MKIRTIFNIRKIRRITGVFLIAAISALANTGNLNAQILWKVSGNGLERPSYLFGTHHAAPVSILDSIKGFNEAFNNVEKVYGEIDMMEMKTPEFMMMTTRHALAPADSTLSKLLTPPQLDSLSSLLGKYSNGAITATSVERMKPSMVATQISLMAYLKLHPEFSQQQQLDEFLQKKGRHSGKKVEGFETARQQIEFLFDTPIRLQLENLLDLMRNADTLESKTEELAVFYKNRDFKGIETMVEESGFDKSTKDILIDKRNGNWIEVLLREMPRQPLMTVVGIAHLTGKKGLVAQLRNLGYTVEPVE